MDDIPGISEHLQDFAAYIRTEIDPAFEPEPDEDMVADLNLKADLQTLNERLLFAVNDFLRQHPDDDAIGLAAPIIKRADQRLFEDFEARLCPPLEHLPPPPSETETADVEMSELSVMDELPRSTLTPKMEDNHDETTNAPLAPPPATQPSLPQATLRSGNLPFSLKDHDNADFEDVLSDEQLLSRYNADYDAFWIEKRQVDELFKHFNAKYTSRLKIEDLIRAGALKDQDTLWVEVKAPNGDMVTRKVRIDGFKGDKGRDARLPKIWLPYRYPNDPNPEHRCCNGPSDIIKAIESHYNERQSGKPAWEALTAFRGNLILGTLHEVRQKLAFWRHLVDRFTELKDLPGRKRVTDKKTGAKHKMPAMRVNKKYVPPNRRDGAAATVVQQDNTVPPTG
ncbi:MAG: hypothetical protein Q9211_004488 [Gyalolechia sp. 1 TL-2023]